MPFLAPLVFLVAQGPSQAEIHKTKVPSASVIVTQNGKTLYRKSFGFANLEWKAQVMETVKSFGKPSNFELLERKGQPGGREAPRLANHLREGDSDPEGLRRSRRKGRRGARQFRGAQVDRTAAI